MRTATSGVGFGAPTVRSPPSTPAPDSAAASSPGSAGVGGAQAPGGAGIPGADGIAANDAVGEPTAACEAPEPVAPPPPAEEGKQDGEAPPGGMVEDCGEMVPAELGDDDPRLTRAFIVSRKQLAAADLARGRDTSAARDAMRAASAFENGDAWERNQRVQAACRELVEQGGRDLERAATVLRRLGFAIYDVRGGGFLAIGWEPETVEGASDWQRNWDVIGWVFDGGPDLGQRHGGVDCSYEQVSVDAFRSMQPAPRREGVRILKVDAVEAWGASASDTERESDGTQPKHPDDVTWHVTVPFGLSLAEGETARNLRARVPALHETQAALWDAWEASGEDLESFLAALEFNRAVTSDDPAQAASVPQLVKGLLPAGMVGVLVGESGCGKSTLAHQLAAAVGGGAADFLGNEIPPDMRGGGVAIIAGEDSRETVATRARRFLDAGLPHPRGFTLKLPAPGVSIADMLASLEKIPNLRLVIVDPAAVWLAGKDEDSSGAVGEFLAALMDFAQRTGAAVLVLHHPRKGRGFALGNLLDASRGSGRWIDAPRIVLGLAKGRGTRRAFGVIKSNLGPDIVEHTVALEGDEESTLWRRADQDATIRGASGKGKHLAPQDDAQAVAAAVAALRGQGERVNRTGARSLFEREPAPLPGWPRSRVDAGVSAALTAGLLVNGPSGLAPPA